MKKNLKLAIVTLLCMTLVFSAGCAQDKSQTTSTSGAPDSAEKSDEGEKSQTNEAAEFYKGKDIEIIVPLGAGGGMDNAARIAAPYLQKLLGAKSVIVTNMTGASGIVAFNWLYTTAKRDGTVICFGSHPANNSVIQQDEAAIYDPLDFCYVGTVQHTKFVLVVGPDSPYKDIETLKKTDKFTIGGFAYNDTMSQYAAVTLEAMNIPNPALIGGYGNSSKCLLAIAQGEIDAYCCPLDSVHRYVEGKQCVPVLVYSKERDPYWPDVPTIYEVFDVSDSTKTMIELLPESDRIIFAPPEVPQERIDFLEICTQKMFEDPEFQKQIIESTGYFSGALNAAETKAVCDKIVANEDKYIEFNTVIDKYIK